MGSASLSLQGAHPRSALPFSWVVYDTDLPLDPTGLTQDLSHPAFDCVKFCMTVECGLYCQALS
jgi:hypothetical protein